jgi:hypothetical protein
MRIFIVFLLLVTLLMFSCGDDGLTPTQAGIKSAEIYCNLGATCDGKIHEEYLEEYTSVSECVDNIKIQIIAGNKSCKNWDGVQAEKCLSCQEEGTTCDNALMQDSTFCSEECKDICK